MLPSINLVKHHFTKKHNLKKKPKPKTLVEIAMVFFLKQHKAAVECSFEHSRCPDGARHDGEIV